MEAPSSLPESDGLRMNPQCTTTVGVILAVAAIAICGAQIKKKHATDVRMIFFFFSLAVVVASLLALVASNAGAIDSRGNLHGSFGEFLSLAMRETLDISRGIYLFSCIAIVITAPQVLTYFLSGLFGVATAPLLTKESVGLVVLGIVKSSAVASGTFMTVAVVGQVRGWDGWSRDGMFAMCMFALLLLMLSFICTLQYRDAAGLSAWIKKCANPPSRNLVASIHQFLTRNQPRGSNGYWDA
jgi:hypothetical protein